MRRIHKIILLISLYQYNICKYVKHLLFKHEMCTWYNHLQELRVLQT